MKLTVDFEKFFNDLVKHRGFFNIRIDVLRTGVAKIGKNYNVNLTLINNLALQVEVLTTNLGEIDFAGKRMYITSPKDYKPTLLKLITRFDIKEFIV